MKIAFALLATSGIFGLSAATLTVGSNAARFGTTATVPVTLASQGSAITALQFDLTTDSSLTVTATLSSAVGAANKSLSSADVSPGVKRFVVIGFTQDAIPDGTLVTLSLAVPATGLTLPASLRISNLAATDKDSKAIILTGTDGALTGTAGPALTPAGSFPHIAVGGGWMTTWTVMNTGSTTVATKINFYGDNGAGASLPVAGLGGGVQRAASIDASIPAGGMVVLQSEGEISGTALSGWAELLSSGPVTGFSVFRYRYPGPRDEEALVPLEARDTSVVLIPFDNSGGFATGIAVTNPTAATQIVTATVTDEAGAVVDLGSLILPPKNHTSCVMPDRFPGSGKKRGTITLTASAGAKISALGIRGNPYGSFTSSPALTK